MNYTDMGPRVQHILATMAILSFAVIVAFAVPISADDTDSNPPDTAKDVPAIKPEPILYLHGYVYDIPAQEDRIVMADVTVTTWVAPDKEYQTVITNNDGSFTVEYNENVQFISFTMAEYTIKGWSSELHTYGDTGIFQIVLKDDSQKNGVHELYDDAGYSAILSRTNAMMFGTVSTVINRSTEPVEGAIVTLYDSKGSYSAKTDSEGYFSINCSSGGSYQMTVSKGGFNTITYSSITANGDSLSLTLSQKDHTILFGLDLTHTLTVFGILIIILIALISIYLIKRPQKEDGLKIVNDLTPSQKKD